MIPFPFRLQSRYFPKLISAWDVWERWLPVMFYYNDVDYRCCDVFIYDHFRQIKVDQEVSNNMLGEYGTLRMCKTIRTLKESLTSERQTLDMHA